MADLDGGTADASGTEEDQKILNLISQTAKKSSYNNSRRQGLDPDTGAKVGGGGEAASSSGASSLGKPRAKKRGSFLCGCGSALEAVDEGAGEKRGDDEGVLRDPANAASYNILHLVGEGGFSKVLLVRAKSGHCNVVGQGVYAAKIIPKAHLKSAGESFIKATMLERNILGEFDHPFLLKLYHSFQEKDKLVLVVDYCPGGSLHTHVNISLREEGKGFDEAKAAFYVAEIGLGIAHLHSHGIIHRDLKLENVLMHGDGHVAVSDFGASKRVQALPLGDCRAGNQPVAPSGAPPRAAEVQAGLAPVQTGPAPPLLAQTKSIVGTPAYMAPEMLLAQPYDFAVDWWALGVLFFTMLKGRLPFDAAEEDKMLWRIVKSKPRYDPNWNATTMEVLRAMLQKRPTTRLVNLKTLGKATLYADYDWVKLEARQIPPPYVPKLQADNDRRYVPKRIAEAAVPDKKLDYKKGDSMQKLFRKFSHRTSFDDEGNAKKVKPPTATQLQ